jgi:hypothetical protein
MAIELMGRAKEFKNELWIDIQNCWNQLLDTDRIFQRTGIDFRLYNFPLCTIPERLEKRACISISEWKQNFLIECDQCSKKDRCGGFFESSKVMMRSLIKPINHREDV